MFPCMWPLTASRPNYIVPSRTWAWCKIEVLVVRAVTTLKTPKCYKHIVKKDYFYQCHLHHRYILTIELKVPLTKNYPWTGQRCIIIQQCHTQLTSFCMLDTCTASHWLANHFVAAVLKKLQGSYKKLPLNLTIPYYLGSWHRVSILPDWLMSCFYTTAIGWTPCLLIGQFVMALAIHLSILVCEILKDLQNFTNIY